MLCVYIKKHEHFSLQTFPEVPQKSFHDEELCFPILVKPRCHEKSIKFVQLHCTRKEKTAVHAFVRMSCSFNLHVEKPMRGRI